MQGMFLRRLGEYWPKLAEPNGLANEMFLLFKS